MSEGAADLVVLAVDDEAPALAEIVHLLSQHPRISAVRTASDATGALRDLQDPARPAPDAVFLDIAMPGLDGLELARVIAGLRQPPDLIFVTAHDERAVQAYEVGAVDYVLKPIRPQRLAAAVARIGRRPPPTDEGPADEMIAVDLAGATRLVPRSTVCWVEAQGDYARLHLTDGTSHLLRVPLSALQDRWETSGFVRIHRGYLVDLARVSELRTAAGGTVVLVSVGPKVVELPVSRRHLKALKDQLFSTVLGRHR